MRRALIVAVFLAFLIAVDGVANDFRVSGLFYDALVYFVRLIAWGVNRILGVVR